MKTPTSRRRRGFTLIELLVVITIIAVLAGAGFAAGNAAIQKAKKTTALAGITGLETAVNNFYTEYGSFPVTAPGTEALTTTTGAGLAMVRVLAGASDATSMTLNPRAIKFLNARQGKNNKDGLIYDGAGTTISGLYDPWGGPYKIVLDDDYDDKISVSPAGSSGSQILNGRKSAAWSEGADYNKPGKKVADDVYSWNK